MSNVERRISNVELAAGVMHSERFSKAEDPLRNSKFDIQTQKDVFSCCIAPPLPYTPYLPISPPPVGNPCPLPPKNTSIAFIFPFSNLKYSTFRMTFLFFVITWTIAKASFP